MVRRRGALNSRLRRAACALAVVLALVGGVVASADARPCQLGAPSPARSHALAPLDEIAIATEVHDERYPAVAYSETADEYLVVWSQDVGTGSTNWDVHAQRISSAGDIVDAPFVIASTPKDEHHPDVVWNPLTDEYLVIWEYWDTINDCYVLARPVTSGGNVGPEIGVCAQPDHKASLNAAVSARDGLYLVVWAQQQSLPTTPPTAQHYVKSQRLDRDGVLLGGEIVIRETTMPFYSAKPAVGYGRARDEFMVALKDQDGDDLIMVQRVGADGALVGATSVVSSFWSNLDGPRLAYAEATDEFLVIWNDYLGHPSPDQVSGRRLQSDGTAVPGYSLLIDPDPGCHAAEIAYHRQAEQYVIAWSAATTEPDARAINWLRLSTNGRVLGQASEVPGVPTASRPAVAMSQHGTGLVVWEDNRFGGGPAFQPDVYGRLIDLAAFEGHVRAERPGSPQPLEGVDVWLHGSREPHLLGDVQAHCVTDAAGWFRLYVGEDMPYYHVTETDPPGYRSLGVEGTGGTMVSENWIRFDRPPSAPVGTNIAFWDEDIPTLTPTTASPPPTAEPEWTATPSTTTTATTAATPTDTTAPTETESAPPKPSETSTAMPTATASPSGTHTSTCTSSATHTATATPSVTTTPTMTLSPGPSATNTESPEATRTPQPRGVCIPLILA